ncbi:YeiH family protein [Isoptericola jiangsuensis]|uniref:YeiH family protein n=1 Tax=Isoptericola jiangsuensis TaxID=548579 RepID=UPI003AADBD67
MTRLLPGLGLTAVAAAALLAAAPALTAAAPALSPLVLALLLGAGVGSVLGVASRRGAPRPLETVTPGTTWAARHVLRAGVVLLGLQLSIGDVLDLGWRGLTVVATTVAVTFCGTLALGRWLRVPRETSLLVATGFSICGAAAVSAMSGVLDRTPGRTRDDDRSTAVAVALALVALYGTLAVLALPWLAHLLGLTPAQAGLWMGASVQEVAQVVAAAGTLAGTAALATATVAKLARVVLLAPLVTTVGAVRARRTAPTASAVPGTTRPPLVPGFVLGFLGAVAVRSLGILPPGVLAVAASASTALLVAAMFALGLGVDVPRLVRTGRRPLVLGAGSAVVVTGTSLSAVLLLTP